MSDIIKELKILKPEKKNDIITNVRRITIGEATKTQAQNLREYSKKTESIEEILLYLEYQCIREKKLKHAGLQVINLIKKYKGDGIDVIRYLLGTFARWVIIESKRGE